MHGTSICRLITRQEQINNIRVGKDELSELRGAKEPRVLAADLITEGIVSTDKLHAMMMY
jgi:hypothetical protein